MKTFFLSFLTAVLLVNGCINGQTQNQADKLPAQAFYEKIGQYPGAVLVDVRTPDEFSKGHLPHALNIDWNGNDFDSKTAALDKQKPVFVYCLSGGRSSSAARNMRAAGFKQVYELDGGIMKWRAANLPETTDNKVKSPGMSSGQFKIMLNSDKTILIDFYADWCAPCKKMKPYLDEIAIEYAGKVEVVRINADDNQDLVRELKIDALPVLQVYKSQNLTWTHTGFIEKAEVLKQLP